MASTLTPGTNCSKDPSSDMVGSSTLSSELPWPKDETLVLVSSEGERFTVEERLAKASSPYFEALLSNDMQESGKCNQPTMSFENPLCLSAGLF
jgi:hypothetical protein